jgi:DNA-binding transcriptional regulator YdaS (Cro superfamily)
MLWDPLFNAVRTALALATGATAIERTTNNTVECQQLRDQDPNAGVVAAGETNTTATWRRKPAHVGKLQQFENVIIF